MLFRVAADTEPAAPGEDARFAVAQLPQRDVGVLAGLLSQACRQLDALASLPRSGGRSCPGSACTTAVASRS